MISLSLFPKSFWTFTSLGQVVWKARTKKIECPRPEIFFLEHQWNIVGTWNAFQVHGQCRAVILSSTFDFARKEASMASGILDICWWKGKLVEFPQSLFWFPHWLPQMSLICCPVDVASCKRSDLLFEAGLMFLAAEYPVATLWTKISSQAGRRNHTL